MKTYDVQINFYVKGAVTTVQTANFKNVTDIEVAPMMTYVNFSDGAVFAVPSDSIVSYTMAVTPPEDSDPELPLFESEQDA